MNYALYGKNAKMVCIFFAEDYGKALHMYCRLDPGLRYYWGPF